MKYPYEHDAWRAAAETAGLDLPDRLQELLDQFDRIESEQRELRAADRPPSTEDAIRAGADATDAATAARQAQQAAEDNAEARRALGGARQSVMFLLRRWCAEHRETLVALLAPTVDGLITQAVPLVDTLDEFAPDYAEANILRDGDTDQIDAWRTSRHLNEQFQACLDAWMTSWRAATSRAGGQTAPPHLRPDRPGGWHVWEHPHRVEDPTLRDGRNTDLLNVAAWHEAGGYRLAGGQQMLDLTQRTPVYHPWLAGERRRRQVILPKQETPA